MTLTRKQTKNILYNALLCLLVLSFPFGMCAWTLHNAQESGNENSVGTTLSIMFVFGYCIALEAGLICMVSQAVNQDKSVDKADVEAYRKLFNETTNPKKQIFRKSHYDNQQ